LLSLLLIHFYLKIILGLAKHPIVDEHNMESLKTIVSAAAPLGKDTEETVRKRLNLDIKQAWGKNSIIDANESKITVALPYLFFSVDFICRHVRIISSCNTHF